MPARRARLFALFILLPLALTAAGDVSPRADRLHRQAIVIDTHIDTPMRLFDEDFDMGPRDANGHIDIPRMREGGLDAAFFSIWVDPRKYQSGAAKRSLDLIATVYEQVERHPRDLVLARTAADVRRAHRQGKIALLMGIEGGHAIEDSLRVLRSFHELGARYMTLTHFLNNNWADASTDTPKHNGLTDFGREVVREMNRLGMLVDISHVSDKTAADALEVSQAPVIASHSSCQALTNIPRNMSDDLLRALAANGGVVQINYGCMFVNPQYRSQDFAELIRDFNQRNRQADEKFPNDPKAAAAERYRLMREYGEKIPRGTVALILDHIDHAVKVAGVDHVGLGSDFDGVPCLPQGMDDVTFLPSITQGLLDRGYSEADIKKILGGNTLRAMEEAERVAARLSGNPKPPRGDSPALARPETARLVH
ncbi:MAG: dipeptidase [Candidatus Acidiferrales bacterium]